MKFVTKQTLSTSQEQTMGIAQRIGAQLKGGECIELIGDVGVGKTTFVRGLAKGADSHDHVSSPTFTISKVYETPRFQIAHFDFYRLQEPGLIEHEIEEVADDKQAVIVVEWSEIVQHVLPENRIQITLTDNESSKQVTFQYPKELAYLIESL